MVYACENPGVATRSVVIIILWHSHQRRQSGERDSTTLDTRVLDTLLTTIPSWEGPLKEPRRRFPITQHRPTRSLSHQQGMMHLYLASRARLPHETPETRAGR